MAAEDPKIAGIECTEDEPDDDFTPGAPSAPQRPAPKDRAPKAEEAAVEDPQEADVEPVPQLPPNLEGNWQQLEGVSRPPGAGARLLCWNSWGHVAVFPSENRIEVHYSSEEKPQRYPNHDGIEMASIAKDACCLAVASTSAGPSRLLIRPRERWDKTIFAAPLGLSENVEAVACGDGFVAALTSKNLLRVYSTSGLPLSLVSVPGRSVALAARGPLLLAVTGTYPGGPPGEEEEDALDYRLIEVKQRSEWSSGRLPLSAGGRLRWLGFSEDFAPVTIDSCGVVRALLGAGAGSWGPSGGKSSEWTPVLNLTDEESKVGPLWAVSASKGELLVAEVGTEALEPNPRPSDDKLPAAEGDEAVDSDAMVFYGVGTTAKTRNILWRLPIGPMTTASIAVEEALRGRLLLRHQQDLPSDLSDPNNFMMKSWKQKVVRVFGELTGAGELERALDLARHSISVPGANQLIGFFEAISEKLGQHQLTDEVGKLKTNLTQVAAPAAPAPGRSRGVAKATREELPALFQPGDVPEERAPNMSSSSSAGQLSPPAPSPAAEVSESPPATSASIRPETVPPTVAAAAPAPPASTNPFARKRPLPQSKAAVEPHLLRDSLAGKRPAPTPMGSPQQPAKKAKV